MGTLQDVKPKKVVLTFRDGSAHEILFTLNALALLEEKYGDIDAAFEKLDKGSFLAIRYMLWAALQHEENPLTEDEVGKNIDISSLSDISGILTEAVENGMPTEEQVLATTATADVKEVVGPNK